MKLGSRGGCDTGAGWWHSASSGPRVLRQALPRLGSPRPGRTSSLRATHSRRHRAARTATAERDHLISTVQPALGGGDGRRTHTNFGTSAVFGQTATPGVAAVPKTAVAPKNTRRPSRPVAGPIPTSGHPPSLAKQRHRASPLSRRRPLHRRTPRRPSGRRRS